jgi:5-methylcytosine-specific restriction endonuclease McrA
VSRLGIARQHREWPEETRKRRAKINKEHPPRLGTTKNIVMMRGGADGKVCYCCENWLALEKFAKHATCAGGRRNICSTCEGRSAYEKYREKKIAAVRRWQKTHPEKYKVIKNAANRRRHGKIMSGPGISARKFRELFESYGGMCGYCHTRKATTIDHKIPLSRGGLHEIKNVIPACKPCNFRKHQKTTEEWACVLRQEV